MSRGNLAVEFCSVVMFVVGYSLVVLERLVIQMAAILTGPHRRSRLMLDRYPGN